MKKDENAVDETPVADTSAEAPSTEGEAAPEAAKPGAPTQTPNEAIADMLPEERVSRSKALNIVRGQDIKCSQERMTKILEAKYGPAPTKEERDAERAKAAEIKKEAADKIKAEKAEERAKAKAIKDEEKAKIKAEKEKHAAELKAKREAAKASKEDTTAEKPSV